MQLFLPSLTAAIKAGHKLRAFASGGHLRVVRLETPGENLAAYGEDDDIHTALKHTEEDCAKGRQHPLRGYTSAGPTCQLDRFILGGRKFNVVWESNQFKFTGTYCSHRTPPQSVIDRSNRTLMPVEYFETEPNGDEYQFVVTACGGGYSSSCLTWPAGQNGSHIWLPTRELVVFAKTLEGVIAAVENPIETVLASIR